MACCCCLTSLIGLGILAVMALIYHLVSSSSKKKKAAAMDLIAKKKRMERDEAISKIKYPALSISESKIQKILDATVTELRGFLLKGEMSSVEILTVFMKRATTIGVELECLAEFDWENSLKEANKADEIYQKEPEKAKTLLLLGIPISIKDNINMKGLDCTVGCADRCFKPINEDGYILKALRAEGAILFVKSNMPQIGLTLETVNAIWGRAKNPWDKTRSAGGSSGGEGGLVAARCSPLGLGTDLGGSIRIPSAFCGIYGFKPTGGRLSLEGHAFVGPALSGQKNLTISFGPIGRSVADLNLMMKAFMSEQFHKDYSQSENGDLYHPFIKWNDDEYLSNRKLKVGILPSTPLIPASEPMKRAVHEAAQALRSRGHEVVEIEVDFFEDIVLLFFQIILSEGGVKILFETAAGEKLIDEYGGNVAVGTMPSILKSLLIRLLSKSKPRLSKLLSASKKLSAREFLQFGVLQDEIKEKFQKLWGQNRLDCLLMPPIAIPSIKHGTVKDVSLAGSYSMFSNVLNLPAGAVPIGLVKEGETIYNKIYQDDIADKIAENMLETKGLPIAVQVLTAPWKDELCLSVMRQIDEVIGFSKKYPLPMM